MALLSSYLRYKKHMAYFSLKVVVLLFINSCVEPFEGVDFIENFEDVLVVNATITNEIKRQEVILIRSFRFDEEVAPAEENAQVSIVLDDGTEYIFEEVEPGKYLSNVEFSAEMNKDYSLKIVTERGKSYASNIMQLPVEKTAIDSLYAERFTNNEGVDGMGIFVDSFDPTRKSNYYRHEYIETYKIIAPFWTPFDAVVISEGISTFNIGIILREREERICYGEDSSKDIIINSTLDLSEDRLDRYNVRFIDCNDYILSYRYSVLVRQYVQSPEAFSYYETLSGLSQSSGNVFSEDQPGFLEGNIFSMDDPEENVAGFFEVIAVDEKRIFFDYEDFYPNEELPPHTVDCIISAPDTEGSLGERLLLNRIRDDDLKFYDYNTQPEPNEGPLLMIRKECGDCTSLGSNVVPDFWIE